MSKQHEITRLHEEIETLRRENQEMRAESEIVDLRGVSPCGETMLMVGNIRNGRWIEVFETIKRVA